MRRHLRFFTVFSVFAVAVGGGLVFDSFSSGALSMAEMREALPRGKDVAGYQVAAVEEEYTDRPSADLPCGKVSVAIASAGRAPEASVQVVLVPRGRSGHEQVVKSYSFSEDDAVRVMKRIRAAIADCAHYNAWYADLYTRHGLKPARSPYQVGDDTFSYRRLDPPAGDKDAGGAPVPLGPGPLQEPGKTITLVRTGGVISQYPDPVPEAVAEDLDRRFRRALTD
ncbi:hypothetical protein ABZZ17_30640 [Streptomyces sp. NPDC006512]|uniref:hypothetical protein n=1 Tax=Streptomyces sp. NPDC006512 TaxID=3154307 RepID=UPI0033B471D8